MKNLISLFAACLLILSIWIFTATLFETPVNAQKPSTGRDIIVGLPSTRDDVSDYILTKSKQGYHLVGMEYSATGWVVVMEKN